MAKKKVEIVPGTGLPRGVSDPEGLWASLSRTALKAVRRLVSHGSAVEIVRASNRGGATYKVAS